MIGKTISHYRIIEELGRGGMGVVYKAEDTKLKRNVALKFLPPDLTREPEAKQRFIREAQTASALDHPNICTIHEINETEDGQLFIVMACYEGKTLKEKIKDKRLKIKEAIDIAIQITDGLSKAHKADIIHRDIKPENIFIDSDGRVKILDFGLAKLKGISNLTQETSTLGTINYMSPEQAQGKEVDHRTDIWSLGILLYEMLTGQPPFMGEYEQATIYAILHDIPAAPSDLQKQISSKVDQLILKCLKKDPQERYQNMQLLGSELNSLGKKTTELPDDEPSIVVLPFDDISPNKDNEYFSDGLTEEIITDLSQIRSLRVISRTTSMVLKGAQKNIGQIGMELNVKYVLEGSVRKAGNNVRITAQLIDAVHDTHLWAEKYDGNLNNVFDLQEKVSQEIQAALRLSVGGEEQKRLEKRYTDNYRAYDLYLKGLHLRRRLRGDDIQKCIEFFEQALEIDPEYALAYAGIAYAYVLLPFYTPVKPSDVYIAGKNAVQKALVLDNQLPEAYESLLLISAYFDWDWDGAKQAGEKIVELNPGYPWGYFHLAHVLVSLGRCEEGIRLLHKALNLDPLNMAFNRNLGYAYLAAGQFNNAIEIAQRTIEIESQSPTAYLLLAKAYLASRKFKEARAAIDKEKGMPQEIIEPIRGIIYMHIDKKEEALSILKKYIERSEDEYTPFYSIAILSIALGKIEQAMDLLEKGYENHDMEMHRIKTDFLLDKVRSEPRFKTLLKKMKLNS